MTRIDLPEALERIRGAESFLITTHSNPDGDAIGSMLALSHFLKALGKSSIVCTSHDPAPRIYQWLPGADTIRRPETVQGSFDLGIVIDVARFERTGDAAEAMKNARHVLILDHHLEDAPDGDWAFIDPTFAAAGEIVTELYGLAGVAMSHAAAECAYVALTTDTGGFRYGNTNARAHRTAAALHDVGLDVFEITSRVFDVMSRRSFALLQRVIDRTVISDDGRVAYSTVTAADMQEVGAAPEDTNGLIDTIRKVEGIQVALLFRELNDGTVKVSMRSRGEFNAAEALKPLGGGGHKGAAGATLSMGLDAARKTVLERVHGVLDAAA